MTTTGAEHSPTYPDLAKFGIALASGARDRGFKSRNLDHVVRNWMSDNKHLLTASIKATNIVGGDMLT